MKRIALKCLSLMALILSSYSASAAWVLDPAASAVNFVSIKNNSVAEVHHFTKLSGQLSDSGEATLSLALDSVETHIPIRNERMRKMLFESHQFTQATAVVAVDMAAFKAIKKGAEQVFESDVKLDLHGLVAQLPAKLRVSRLSKKQYRVATVQPVIVNAADFDLLAGIEALREIAKLKAIGAGVPVSLSLGFTAE